MYTTAFTLALATSAVAGRIPMKTRQTDTCILDTVNNPSQQQVVDSINQWNTDVNSVNSFLNTALSLSSSDLGTAAQTALHFAQDEPCQLMTLASQSDFAPPSVAAFDCAVSDLKNIFGPHVLDNLNTIISNPGDTASAHAAVNDINLFRCCNVLPDASILFRDSAEDNGEGNSVQTTANRPDACASIDCSNASPKCDSEDNGTFGK